jgi:hypothetical protein
MDCSIISWIGGAVTAVVAGLLGGWFNANRNFRYQEKLLKQQLEFQKESQKLLEACIKDVTKRIASSLETLAARAPGGPRNPDVIRARRGIEKSND